MNTGYFPDPNNSGEFYAVVTPRVITPDPLPLIIWSHYSAGSAFTTTNLSGPGVLFRRLARAGYYTLGGDIGPAPHKLWANDSAMTRLTQMVAWGQANLRVASGPVHFVVSSMGTSLGLRFYRGFPDDVLTVIGVLPVNYVQQARIDYATSPNLRADIDAAFGVTYPAALPFGADPINYAAISLVGMPYLQFTASNDDLASAAKADSFADIIGAAHHIDLGAVGHSDAAFLSVDPVTVLRHFAVTEGRLAA